MNAKCCCNKTNLSSLPNTAEICQKPIITLRKGDQNGAVVAEIFLCSKATTVASGLPILLENFIKIVGLIAKREKQH